MVRREGEIFRKGKAAFLQKMDGLEGTSGNRASRSDVANSTMDCGEEVGMGIDFSQATRLAFYVSAASIGLFASYVAYLVVKEIVRVVVPTVVEAVVGS